MSWVVWLFRGLTAVLLCTSLTGCMPSGSGQTEDEREPHFLAGKSCLSSMDYRGAVKEFEKAVEVNPHSAAAHFQLGWLYEEKVPDPAAAIYHYEQYLKLRPHSENAGVIREHIANCKRDLARSVLPLPVSPDMQRRFEQVVERNRQLRQALDKWQAYAKHLRARLTNQMNATAATSQSNPSSVPVPLTVETRTGEARSKTVSSTASPRVTHAYVVKAGDSMYGIARRHGITLEALRAANPGQDPRKLRIGQTLNLPSP